jgi:hypothetical protein
MFAKPLVGSINAAAHRRALGRVALEAELRNGDYFGAILNRAARAMGRRARRPNLGG